MSFEGIALSEHLKGGRTSGIIELTASNICFSSESSGKLTMPLSGLELKQGGAGNRYVYFTHPKHIGLCFYTDDLKILNTDEIRLNAQLIDQTRKIKTNRKSLNVFLGIVVIGIVLLISSVFVFKDQIVKSLSNKIPPSFEQKVSSTLKQSAIAGKKTLENKDIQNQLKLITDALVKHVEDTSFHFNFTIVKDDVLNAFALPGGEIVINSGLIEKSKSPEELAGVLAHEICHVTGRHHMRNIIGSLGLRMIVSSFIGDVSTLTAQITKAGISMSSLKYSRDFEREADNDGFDLLLRAGIHTQGMIDFFETMKKEQGPINADNLDFLSTHPGTDERISALKNKKNNEENFTPISINFEQFKKDIKAYFK